MFKKIILLLVILSVSISSTSKAEDKETDIITILKKPSYVYTSAGKPDPFEPFILKEEYNISSEELKKLKLIPSHKTELQRISLKELRIVAMVKIDKKVLAMVQGPTGKGYIVKPGMGIGMKGGVVDKIIYKEVPTPLGKKIIRKIVIKEPFIDRNKISFRYIELKMDMDEEVNMDEKVESK